MFQNVCMWVQGDGKYTKTGLKKVVEIEPTISRAVCLRVSIKRALTVGAVLKIHIT